MRYLSNGDIVFPRRGKPPACPSGYEPIKGEPFKFRPILPECDSRILKDYKQPCGRIIKRYYCKEVNQYVERQICAECMGGR